MKKIYKFLNGISDFFQRPLELISGITLFVGAAALFFQVINRYILAKLFNISFSFTDELARYTIIWFTYMIAGVCLKEGRIVSLNLLYDRLPKITKYVLYYLTRVFMLFFCFIVVKYVVAYIPTAAKFHSATLQVPGIFLYSFPGIGFAFMAYEIITETCGVIAGELQPFCPGRFLEEAETADFS